VVCQACRDAGEIGPAFQMLIYPATDSSRQSASRQAFAEGYFLTKSLIDWFWTAYAPAGADLADLRFSPLLAKDLTGLPPAFVLTAGFDPLRDEGRAYADRLIDAGVKTTYVNYPGTIHGFFSLTRFLQQGLKANDEAAAVLAAHFGTGVLALGQHAQEGDRLAKALQLDAFLAAAELGEQRLHRRIVGHGARQHDVAAFALALQAGRHVHRRAEVVEPIVEVDHHARAGMDAQLEHGGVALDGGLH